MENNTSNIITNTKPVADSFVNDQLKWRRERIEELTKQRTKYFQLYQNECRFVKHLSELINLLIKSKLSGDNGEPVEHKHFRNLSWFYLFGLYPDFRTASMYFAEVPKRFIFSFSARSQSLLGPP